MDHYEVLGVSADADVAQIRRAYLASARLHHPDFHVADTDAERAGHASQMKAVTEAWHVLGDAGRRAEYDDRLLRARAGPAGRRGSPAPDVPSGKGWTPRPDDDGWIDDFDAWADERDRLLPDDDPVGPGRRSLGVVIAVGLFVVSVVVGFLGLVFEARSMLAAAVAGVVVSSVLFMLLPLVAMTRHRPRAGEPSTTKERTPFTGGGTR